ncbi:peptidylprolyl isomerase [Spirochaetia bacterium]|nr:peptidylprolyl isomerase [Spirochaetia bacterium]GHU31690.1 peptidylprolyl isomerase [Spirochaetia bacterium]
MATSEAGAAAPFDLSLGAGLFAKISTSRGDIIVNLEYQKVPLAVCNFVALAEGKMDINRGRRFYDGLTFHRVVSNFMVQGGDPLGTGRGGPGYSFPDEFDSTLKHDRAGILSMANAGPGTNGSQFFITHRETPWLDGKHTVFGEVVSGQEVVDALQQGDKIMTIRIIRNGIGALAFRADQTNFDILMQEYHGAAQLKSKLQRESDTTFIERTFPDAVISPSGIRYQIQNSGKGEKTQSGQIVRVRYRGKFLSGRVFDDSDLHGGPLEFTAGIGQVIPGWDEMVMDMCAGERRVAIIPPELAYGERGIENAIPPNSFLIFEMELVAIRNPPEGAAK